MPVTPDLLAADLAKIRERRGKRAVRMGDEIIPTERIPLESPTIMRVTDGGIPIGRVSRLWGDPSSGKTHLGYLILAAAQNLRTARFPDGLSCAYWNVEGIWDAAHAAHLGVDPSKVVLEETKVIEDIAAEMELLLRSVHLHVLDSTSSAKSVDELAAKPEDWLPMIKAKAWQRALDRIENAFDGDDNALILISHQGERIDMKKRTSVKYAKGGKSLHFASSLDLHFTQGSWLYYHPIDGYLEKDEKIAGETGLNFVGLKEPDGIEVTVCCMKSRVGRQFRSGKMRLDLNTFEFDYTFELLDAASYFDEDGNPAQRSGKKALIYKTGERSSWYMCPDGKKVQGDRGIRKRLVEDQELESMIRIAMLAGN